MRYANHYDVSSLSLGTITVRVTGTRRLRFRLLLTRALLWLLARVAPFRVSVHIDAGVA